MRKTLLNAHRQFRRWEPYVGLLIATGFFSFVGKNLSVFGELGWPAAIFLGLGAASVLTLVLSATLVAWRLFRPLPKGNYSLPILDHPFDAEVEHRRLSDQVQLIAASLTGEAEDQNRINQALTERLDAADTAAKAAHDYAEACTVALENLLKESREKIESLSQRLTRSKVDRLEFQEKMEAWVDQFRESVERRFEWIDQGFMAVLDRERLLRIAASIEEIGESLSGPTYGNRLVDWDDWQRKETQWRVDIQEWANLAAVYRSGAWDRIFRTPERDYRGKWKATDDLFPDAEAIYVYRTFRIILRNFREERPFVESSVRMAAFARPSLKGRGTVTRDENQMPLPPKVQS